MKKTPHEPRQCEAKRDILVSLFREHNIGENSIKMTFPRWMKDVVYNSFFNDICRTCEVGPASLFGIPILFAGSDMVHYITVHKSDESHYRLTIPIEVYPDCPAYHHRIKIDFHMFLRDRGVIDSSTEKIISPIELSMLFNGVPGIGVPVEYEKCSFIRIIKKEFGSYCIDFPKFFSEYCEADCFYFYARGTRWAVKVGDDPIHMISCSTSDHVYEVSRRMKFGRYSAIRLASTCYEQSGFYEKVKDGYMSRLFHAIAEENGNDWQERLEQFLKDRHVLLG